MCINSCINKVNNSIKELRLIDDILVFYKEIQQYFNEVIDAFLQKDDKLNFRVWMKEDVLFNTANKLIGNLDYENKEKVKKIMKIAQKIKDMSAFI